MTPPVRTVHCDDALSWLESQPTLEGCSLVASMPDISEFPTFTLDRWKEWFFDTAKLIMSRCPDNGVTTFYQSDIKFEGTWIDKSYLCQKAAENLSHSLLWHKIVCRSPAGIATYGRPSYSHMLCFSKGFRLDISKSTPDVLPEIGDKTWQRGMGLEACREISKFILTQTSTRTIVNPFCGEGSMLAVANSLGLNAVGIERSPKRAKKAEALQLDIDNKKFVF